MSRTIVVQHLARIEGHAGITVELGDDGERVTCDVTEGIRLFEGLVRGRHFTEVPAIVSRICAICSHAHALTAIEAMERACEVEVSEQTRLLRDLAYQGSTIESHALHVFLLALPDLLGHASALGLAAVAPETVTLGLRLKKLGNTIQEVIGGRAVHPVNYVIGGFGRLPSTDDLVGLKDALEAGVADCDAAVRVVAGLRIPAAGDAPLRCAALVPEDDALFFGRRVRLSGGRELPVEHYPSLTNERTVAHSHAKHSLCDGSPYLVGALARLTINGERYGPRANQVRERLGLVLPTANVLMNNVAQVVELVYAVDRALAIVTTLLERTLDAEPAARPRVHATEVAAASEAPRGTLFHRYALDAEGRVAAADVITPTAQNFSHLEAQLLATVRRRRHQPDEQLRHDLEVLARAYDPCVSSSVHTIRAR